MRLLLILPLLLASVPLEARQACPDSTWVSDYLPAGSRIDLGRLAQLDRAGAAPQALLIRRASTRVLLPECTGSALRQLAAEVALTGSRDGFSLAPFQLELVNNSGYPTPRNDGTLWAGVGLSALVTAGLEMRAGPVTVAAAPHVAYHGNAGFVTAAHERPGMHPLADPWTYGIDLPQRFGSDPFWSANAGGSYARLDVRSAGIGVSNENLWWGAGRHNSIILGSAAPGFPHLFLETNRPVDIWIGNAEGQLLWGMLQESDYFDNEPDNDRRVMAGVALTFQPRGADGLFLGGARIKHRNYPPGGLSLGEILLSPYRGVRENPEGFEAGDNQLISLFFRWAVPAGGVEVYGEWAREDHWEDLVGLLKLPDASQAFQLGLQKLIGAGADRRMRIGAEIIRLSDALPILHAGRGTLIYYTHADVIQGHTHRGQLLGARTGPGSDSQVLDVDLFWRGGQTGLSLERTRYNDDIYYSTWSWIYGPHGHDLEVSGRLRQLTSFRRISVAAELGLSHRWNRYFIGHDWSHTRDHVYRTERNLQGVLNVRWAPDLRLPLPSALRRE
jgi:hypothetical protein